MAYLRIRRWFKLAVLLRISISLNKRGTDQPSNLFHYHLPNKEAEQTEERVHEAHVMANSCDDGLLAVWAYRLHRCWLEHLTLQHSDRSSSARWSNHCGCVSHSWATVARSWNKLPRHGLGEVSRRRVEASWKTVKKKTKKQGSRIRHKFLAACWSISNISIFYSWLVSQVWIDIFSKKKIKKKERKEYIRQTFTYAMHHLNTGVLTSTVTTFFQVKAWKSLTEEETNSLVISVSRRIDAVIESKGYASK